jgi:hypothetical protein
VNWASHAIELLQKGQQATITPHGSSMTGRVNDGSTVVLAPLTATEPQVDDVVLVRVKGSTYLHLVKALDSKGRYQIGNNRGGINGWVSRNAIYGRAISINGVKE